MIKICHMTSAHSSTDDRIFDKECVSLAKEDCFDVSIVAPGESFKKENVSIIGIGNTDGNRINRIIRISKRVFLAAIKLDADIYHFHDPELLLYALKLKKRGKIVIFDSHENYYFQIKNKYYIPSFMRKIVAALYFKYETHVCKRIDAVVFPCLMFGKHPFEGRCNHTILLNNVPSKSGVYDKYDETKKRSNSRTVCYTGGLTMERGIMTLMKACYAADAKLILAGRFSPNSYFDELCTMKEYECVDYRGQCSHDEVLKILDEAAIGANILTNSGQYYFTANLSTKVYEFMAFGLPVIINDYEYGRKLVDTYKFGFTVDSDNDIEISKKISYLLENKDVADNMGKAGRNLIRDVFNWDIEGKKLIALYEKLIKEKFDIRQGTK